MKAWSRFAIALLCASPAQAAELVHLSNGYDVHCIRRETLSGVTRLYVDVGGFIDVPSQQISGYESDPAASPQAPQPIPADYVTRRETASLPLGKLASQQKQTIHDHIRLASIRNGVDADFIESVVRAESGYNVAAMSPKGARGLMQLMPATAASLGVQDSLDPKANIDAGSRYLRELLVRFDGDAVRALAAYNAGPQKVQRYKGVPPYHETRIYVARVIKDYNRRKLSASEISARDQKQKALNTPARGKVNSPDH